MKEENNLNQSSSNSILIWDKSSLKFRKLIDKAEQQRIDRKHKLEKINALQPILRKIK